MLPFSPRAPRRPGNEARFALPPNPAPSSPIIRNWVYSAYFFYPSMHAALITCLNNKIQSQHTGHVNSKYYNYCTSIYKCHFWQKKVYSSKKKFVHDYTMIIATKRKLTVLKCSVLYARFGVVRVNGLARKLDSGALSLSNWAPESRVRPDGWPHSNRPRRKPHWWNEPHW